MKHKIEHIAESLVLTDPADMQALARLHDLFGDVVRLANELQNSVVASAGTAAAKVLEEIIMKETDDAAGSLKAINDTVAALQAIVAEGRSVDEVSFPERLNLSDGRADSVGSVDDSSSNIPQLPSNVDESIFKEFLSNLPGVLDDIEAHVLTLDGPAEQSQVDTLLRMLHTLKGESGLMGLGDVERLVHTAEDTIANRPHNEITDLLLEVKDWISRTSQVYAGKGDPPPPVDELIAKLASNAPASAEPDTAAPSAQADEIDEDETPLEPIPLTGDPELTGEFISEAMEHLERSDAKLLTIETTPEDDDALNAVFRAFHTIKGVAGFLELTDIQSFSHEAENLLDAARMGQLVLKGRALDVTFDAVDMLKRLVEFVQKALTTGSMVARDPGQAKLMARIRAAKEAGNASPADDTPESTAAPVNAGQPIGEILKEQGKVIQSDIEQALDAQASSPPPQPPIGEILVSQGKVTPKEAAQALRSQQKPPAEADASAPSIQQGKSVKVAETVRVDSLRLDAMVNAIGEMVIAEAMVSQSPDLTALNSSRLTRSLSHLDKITRELQDMATSLRMMPIRQTFQRMARLVRDVAKKINKQVNFTMTGEETELDKSVVDQIGDPLVHMVRNSVDHGIEGSVEERRAAGKPDAGQVTLRAFHKSGSIYIEIEDDGRGLDKDRILEKAKEKGLVRDGDNLTDNEIYNLVFEPGFSTAKVVSDVSGRGVGMDVVKRNIQALRGQVEIQSTPGKGSIFSIRLPLTLAIIEGMIVRVGSERFILPLLQITRMLRPEEHGVPTVFGQAEMLSVSEGLIPLYRLHAIFGISDAEEDPANAAVVIIEYEGRKYGLLVDDLLGQQQIVIKSLGDSLKDTECIAGGAIMPDGLVGLIIDIDSLIKVANKSVTPTPKAT